ncbi:MAG TPA: EutN/CcmL family microcompartment protein [Anaeromyxobacteraceae bacterium]|nr:EutN/CcmL family microcompartment protein [Anaeromyxobacteraceae bacterium]
MRLGAVIGRVTLNEALPSLSGGRFLIVNPFTRTHMQQGGLAPSGLSAEPSLVVYDDIGAGQGDTVGFVEGREAAVPFKNPTPIDALDVAIVDEVHRPKP